VFTVPHMIGSCRCSNIGATRSDLRSIGELNRRCGVNERGSRVSSRSINEAFANVTDAAKLDPSLDLHCQRPSCIAHLIEFDYPEKFVSTQVGQTYAATTVIYTGVSDEFRNRLLQRALGGFPELWETP
jgi:site-specific recombinase XerC